LQAGYRSKKQFNPYMVICNFIGYFTFNAMWLFSGTVSLSLSFLTCLALLPTT
jgi:hypothetical protein